MKLAEVIIRDITANKPAATAVAEGSIFFDETLETLDRSDGTIWESITPNALVNPMTTLGDIITGGASGTPERLGIADDDDVLTLVGGVPVWLPSSGGGGGAETGLMSARPATPATGTIYVPTDAEFYSIYDGSAWLDYGHKVRLKRPGPQGILASLTAVNQGTGTYTETDRGILLVPQITAANRMLVKAAPTPPYTFTIGFTMAGSGAHWFGLAVRLASSGAWQNFSMDNTAIPLFSIYWSSLSGFSSTPMGATQCGRLGALVFMRLTDDGTTRSFWTSPNGVDWRAILSVVRTAHITPDQIGLGFDASNAALQVMIMHWEVT